MLKIEDHRVDEDVVDESGGEEDEDGGAVDERRAEENNGDGNDVEVEGVGKNDGDVRVD